MATSKTTRRQRPTVEIAPPASETAPDEELRVYTYAVRDREVARAFQRAFDTAAGCGLPYTDEQRTAALVDLARTVLQRIPRPLRPRHLADLELAVGDLRSRREIEVPRVFSIIKKSYKTAKNGRDDRLLRKGHGRGARYTFAAADVETLAPLVSPDVEGQVDARKLLEALDPSPRQHDILRLLAAGNTPAEVARELGIGEPTVRVQLHRLRKKAHV